MKRDEVFAVSLLVVLLATLLGGPSAIADQTINRTSNVTVAGYVAIALSTNWTLDNIQFGTLDPATNDNNATHNNDSTGGNSSYWVEVSTDSNLDPYICLRDDWALNSTGGDVIGNGNFTWNTTLSGGPTEPILAGIAMNTTDVDAWGGNTVPRGQNLTFRFWLDIPLGQAFGTYNNTVFITGKTTPC
jgi:hypothetical protein